MTKCLLAEEKGYEQETVTKGHRVLGLGGAETSLQGGTEQAGSTVNLGDQGQYVFPLHFKHMR